MLTVEVIAIIIGAIALVIVVGYIGKKVGCTRGESMAWLVKEEDQINRLANQQLQAQQAQQYQVQMQMV
jgi:hypothetical protein